MLCSEGIIITLWNHTTGTYKHVSEKSIFSEPEESMTALTKHFFEVVRIYKWSNATVN